MGRTSRLVTFEDLFNVPDIPGKRELIAGELHELSPAKRNHNRIAEEIYLALIEAARGRRGSFGQPHIAVGYRVSRNPDSWLVPDVSVAHPDQDGADYHEGAPLVAVEIVSESNSAPQIDRKRALYLEHGADEVWVVVPMDQVVRVYRADDFEEFAVEIRSAILPGLRIDLTRLFAA